MRTKSDEEHSALLNDYPHRYVKVLYIGFFQLRNCVGNFVKHFSKLCALLTLSSLAILVDSSRVFLSSSEPEKNYINASFVDVSK